MPAPLSDVREISKLAYGFMASKALFAALDLELFGHISRGTRDVTALAAATGVAPHRMQTLTSALVSVGVLLRDGEGVVNAPATETYLVPGAPAYFGDYYRFQIGRQIYPDMNHLLAGLTGDEDGLAHKAMSGWLADPERAADFSRAQHAGSMGTGVDAGQAARTGGRQIDAGRRRRHRRLFHRLLPDATRSSAPPSSTFRP